jgi:hypothetical protein
LERNTPETVNRIRRRLHLVDAWLALQGAAVGAAVATVILVVLAWQQSQWTAVAAVFSALSFVLALWLAMRVHRSEQPNLRIFKVERLRQLEVSHSRTFAALIEIQIANLSRAGNAIIALDVLVRISKDFAPMTIVRPNVSAVDGRPRYVVQPLNWEPPPETRPTVLPATIGALGVERLDFVVMGRLDTLYGTNETNELLMAITSGDPANYFIYEIAVTIKDIFDRVYSTRETFRP